MWWSAARGSLLPLLIGMVSCHEYDVPTLTPTEVLGENTDRVVLKHHPDRLGLCCVCQSKETWHSITGQWIHQPQHNLDMGFFPNDTLFPFFFCAITFEQGPQNRNRLPFGTHGYFCSIPMLFNILRGILLKPMQDYSVWRSEDKV